MQQRGDYIDEKVGSILTDLGYTKTRHHDKYVITLFSFLVLEKHPAVLERRDASPLHGCYLWLWFKRCVVIRNLYSLEASPKVIYPALREFDSSLRPENIKSHLQVGRNSEITTNTRNIEATRKQIN